MRPLRQLSFGHPSAAAAIQAIAPSQVASMVSANRVVPSSKQNGDEVVERLQRYAEGVPVDFCDLPVDSGDCDRVPSPRSKGLQGNPLWKNHHLRGVGRKRPCPGAARAVGNCMAGNRVPLIIPCHRVVRAGGDIGPYSAAGGSATKRRLLKMEAANSRVLTLATNVASVRLDYQTMLPYYLPEICRRQPRRLDKRSPLGLKTLPQD